LLPFVCLIFPVQVWDDANDEALRLTQTDGLTYVPPFDHPLLW
jgi:threonine dehydratase